MTSQPASGGRNSWGYLSPAKPSPCGGTCGTHRPPQPGCHGLNSHSASSSLSAAYRRLTTGACTGGWARVTSLSGLMSIPRSSAVVASFRGLLGPLLSSLNWPLAPFRVPGAHPVLRTPLPLVAWRWTPALQTRVHQILLQWYPAGIQRAVALHAHRPWPCTDAIPPAAEDLFPVGIAAPGAPLKKRAALIHPRADWALPSYACECPPPTA